MKFGMRELVFAGVMAVMLGGAWYFVFNKSNAKRERLQAEIESRQSALENLKQSTAGIDNLNQKIDELQQAIHFFESKLPQAKEVDTILEEVWQMAQRNALESRTIQTLRPERGPNYSEQPIRMNLSGDFEGFYEFMLELEKLPRITRVTHMDLKKISNREGKMEAQLTLSIFFEPDDGSHVATVR